MKIVDILKEEDWKQDTPGFKSKQTDFNPDTGQYTWDVDYTPIKSVDSAIEKAYEGYKQVLSKYPEDEKLETLFNVFASFKKAFRTHVSRKYKE
tara:strand:- start:395 stop:676 length:282 start_codon:yes stop_codon:yes gene_type:complete